MGRAFYAVQQEKGATPMKQRDILLIGLMLFSMFFGAGNLMFPPLLGAEAGTSLWLAMLGFIVTAVGLPLVVLIAISLVKGGAQELGNRVHPHFSSAFTVIVYLSIGPFLAIPRNANVAYEMGFKPFIDGSPLTLFIFTVIFFALVYAISLNPSKMVDYMGKWITPILLLAMAVLCIAAFMQLHEPLQAPKAKYEASAFFAGFIDGYSTMDALASLAFGIVILTALQQRGITDPQKLTHYTAKAGFIAGIALAAVYIALGLLGAKMAPQGSFENGTTILSSAASLLFGQGGNMLLGFIFTLACFTTCVGLTTACGQYFAKLVPKASYKTMTLIVTLVSFGLANLGLNQILTVSVPFLVMAYPLTIVLVALAFLHRFFAGSRAVYASAMLFTGIFSLYDGLKMFGLESAVLNNVTNSLPFSAAGLGWVVPAIVGAIVGSIISRFSSQQSTHKTNHPS